MINRIEFRTVDGIGAVRADTSGSYIRNRPFLSFVANAHCTNRIRPGNVTVLRICSRDFNRRRPYDLIGLCAITERNRIFYGCLGFVTDSYAIFRRYTSLITSCKAPCTRDIIIISYRIALFRRNLIAVPKGPAQVAADLIDMTYSKTGNIPSISGLQGRNPCFSIRTDFVAAAIGKGILTGHGILHAEG